MLYYENTWFVDMGFFFCLLKFIPHRCNSKNLKAPLLFVIAKSFPLSVLVPLFQQQNLCLNSCNLAFLQFAWMQHCSSIVFAMYGCCMWWWLTFGSHLEYLGDFDLSGIAQGCNGHNSHMWSPMKTLFSSACKSICRAGSRFDYWSLSQHPVLLYAALYLIADNRNCVSSHPSHSHTSYHPHPPSSLGLGVKCCFPRLKRKGDGVWWGKGHK